MGDYPLQVTMPSGTTITLSPADVKAMGLVPVAHLADAQQRIAALEGTNRIEAQALYRALGILEDLPSHERALARAVELVLARDELAKVTAELVDAHRALGRDPDVSAPKSLSALVYALKHDRDDALADSARLTRELTDTRESYALLLESLRHATRKVEAMREVLGAVERVRDKMHMSAAGSFLEQDRKVVGMWATELDAALSKLQSPPGGDAAQPPERAPAEETSPTGTWRVGTKVGRTLYIGDEFIGHVDTPELAAQIVAAINGRSAPTEGPSEVSPLPWRVGGFSDGMGRIPILDASGGTAAWTLMREDAAFIVALANRAKGE